MYIYIYMNMNIQIYIYIYIYISRCCALCGGAEHGLTHILASCVEVWYEQENFLHDAEWRASLAGALPGDWPAAVLSPHSGTGRLQQAVCYVATLVTKLESAARH